MACPLMFSMAGMRNGADCDPTPMVIASGIGVSMCVASVCLFRAKSRIMAHPEALRTSTFSPYFL